MGFKVSFTDLSDGTSIDAQYVPVEIEETHGARYAELAVQGLTHQIMQYAGGDNMKLAPTFEFNRDTEQGLSVLEQRKYILSLLVPKKAANSPVTGAPPDVLFVWPKLFSFTSKITQVKITHTLFDGTGAPRLFKAAFAFSEIRNVRISSEEVRRDGTVRAS